MKKLTLDMAWKRCMAQWRYVIAEYNNAKKPVYFLVEDTKREWLDKKGYDLADNDCWFCEYALQHHNDGSLKTFCSSCPARKIDKSFLCCEDEYNYEEKPEKFYAKLKSIYRKYLSRRRNRAVKGRSKKGQKLEVGKPKAGRRNRKTGKVGR